MKKVEENAAEPQYTHKLQLVEEFLDKPGELTFHQLVQKFTESFDKNQ